MRFRFVVQLFLTSFFLWGLTAAQIVEDETREKARIVPQVIDFSRIFDQKAMTREEFELWKSRRDARLRARLTQLEALERVVDPEDYLVGPGDIFSFNVWGMMETHVPAVVSPEGKLLLPSVGEIVVSGKTLAEVQSLVIERAAPFYKNIQLTLTLEGLRLFRIHVTGEVLYPSTYIAQAVDRISEMIATAGGVTEWAWSKKIELRHPDGSIDYFDLDSFELEGILSENLFVNGGDVIYVPPIEVGGSLVRVNGGFEYSGTYQLSEGENLLSFLRRNRVLKKDTDLSKIVVIRDKENTGSGTDDKQFFTPFESGDSFDLDFLLQNKDEINLPWTYVYVKGAVRSPGAFPYIMNLTAKDYAGIAGGEFRSGSIKGVRVYHALTGETEKGADVLVHAGDVVHLKPSWSQRLGPYLQILPVLTSFFLAAKAAGLLGEK